MGRRYDGFRTGAQCGLSKAVASDKTAFPESVLSDFKGLRRHSRVSWIAHVGLKYIVYML